MTQTQKPMWTRCAACKWRVYNTPADIEYHLKKCPADTERTIKNLRRDLETALDRIHDLETHNEQTAVPAVVDDEIAEWPDLHPDTEPADDDEVSLDHPAAGEPAEHPTDDDADDAVTISPNPAMAYFHPAQVDDLDARIARQTGAIG